MAVRSRSTNVKAKIQNMLQHRNAELHNEQMNNEANPQLQLTINSIENKTISGTISNTNVGSTSKL